MSSYQSWGRYPKAVQDVRPYGSRKEKLPIGDKDTKTFLGYGYGRSYGDSCLNDDGVLIATRGLNRIINLDQNTGELYCEAGVLLSEILEYIVPRGWFLKATPGTKFVTVGGAIANDVHGKNHHRTGTFGCNVIEFELLRSDGQRLVCSNTQNFEWFCATIGGLGLTGIITTAKIQLMPIHNAFMQVETIKYANLDEFFELSDASEKDFEYTVAWIDCMAKNDSLGRGLFSRGNHLPPTDSSTLPEHKPSTLSMPCDLPGFTLNRFTVKAFNFLYYNKQIKRHANSTTHYSPFFYPLDSIQHWNRMYGKKGFMQHQCVVPIDDGKEAIREIIQAISASGYGSFLAVLKIFGDIKSPGLMSFPRRGITLALDFPNQGDKVFTLLNELDVIVSECNGAVYPAKDARMSGENFRNFFPQWTELQQFMDPQFSSSFWRRVTGD